MQICHSGRSAVRLAHLLWEQGVEGSNPFTPTIKQKMAVTLRVAAIFMICSVIISSATAPHNIVKQSYAAKRYCYYAEIIEIIAGKKFPSSNITHNAEINKENNCNESG